MKLRNYVNGEWVEGQGVGAALCDAVTGEELARAGSDGVDMAEALDYARNVASPALQSLTYLQRGKMLKEMAVILNSNRERYGEIARKNSGNTAVDAMVDIDGGIGTLGFYSSLAKKLGDKKYIVEPGFDQLSRDEFFKNMHVLTPLKGVAIHINAFNFPSWGLWEKAAVALLSGVSVFCKPATTSSWLTYEMVKDIVDADILPNGAISLICGGGYDLMDHVKSGDAVLFTGSAETANTLRNNSQLQESGVRLNIEADSVNMVILGEDVEPAQPLFAAFIKEVVKEMTTKAGQKCTAIRRVLVPEKMSQAVAEALVERLNKISVGNPNAEGVRMGPLMNKSQQKAAIDGIELLKQDCDVVFGDNQNFELVDGSIEKGCFVQPTLLKCVNPLKSKIVHETEVFGPVATMMTYESAGQAIMLANRGGGSLAGSVFSNNSEFTSEALIELSSSHGRLLVVNDEVIKTHTGHGVVMPQCVHGGPGRAGGGEELGGLRGLRLYHQRTAIQGHIDELTIIEESGVQCSV